MMTQCKYGRFARSCMSVGLCDCGRAAELAEMELAAPVLAEVAGTEKRRRLAIESDLRRTGRNNAVYVVKVRGQLVITDKPHPMPFERAFSGEHPSKHALAYIERVTGKSNANG